MIMRGIGVFVLLLPFLPLVRLYPQAPDLRGTVPPTEWLLGAAIFGFAGWLLARVAGSRVERAVAGAAGRAGARAGRLVLACGVGLAILLVAVSSIGFRHRPVHVDSVVQLFQAEIFAAGMLEAPRPPEPPFFAALNMVLDDTGWYSQYPPGHALMLVPGVLARAPWLVPIALSLGSFAFLVGFARLAWDHRTALLVALLLLLCPFFWFMGASFMNHVSALFFVSAFLYGFARWERGGATGWMVAAGIALGAATLSRPLTAVAVAAVFGVVAIVRGRERRTGPVVAGLAFAGVASLYLAYNAATTGHPLVPGYIELWGTAHGLGFHPTPWGDLHTPLAGLRNELIDLSLLNLFLFEWPIPALWPLGIALAAGWLDDRWSRRLVVAFLALPLAYLFHWHRDAFLGPRYLYAGVAFAVPLTAHAMIQGWERLGGRVVRKRSDPEERGRGAFRPAAFAAALVGLCFLYSLAWGIPQRFVIHATGRGSMKVDLPAEARAAGIESGVVFVATSWGNRLLAAVYGLGAPASTAERVYRRSDHCELQRLVDTALREGWSPARTDRAMSRLVVPRNRLVATSALNGDPTLRLARGRGLAARCREEIEHDRRGGYSLYVPHLIANTPTLDGRWVVARDMRDRNAELLRRYPERRAYLFRGSEFLRLR